MRRACCACHVPLDDSWTTPDPLVSHGLCPECADAVHLEIDSMPTCGLVGPWGECNLFADHVGECRQLRED